MSALTPTGGTRATTPPSVAAEGPASHWSDRPLANGATTRLGAIRQAVRRDPHLWTALALAALAGVVASAWSFSNNLVLAYFDSQTHLDIARRVLDSPTPGIAQFGTVWLPVPHALLLPFVAITPLWTSGLAGTIVGWLCFIATTFFVFGTVRALTRVRLAPWIAVAVFALNPNVLYLQSTALTEPVLMATMTGASYCLVRWARRQTSPDLIQAGILSMMAVGSRYDGWFFSAAAGALVALTAILYDRTRASARQLTNRAEAVTLAFSVFPVYAGALWFFYNWLIFGDPLEFERGTYSALQLNAKAVAQLQAAHNLGLSFSTYAWAVVDNAGWITLLLAGLGVATYLAVNRLHPSSLTAYLLLTPFVFNVLAIYVGQSAMLIPQSVPPGLFNTRYGTLMLPGLAVFIGYLASRVSQRISTLGAGALLGSLLLVQWLFWVPGFPHSAIVVEDTLNLAASAPELEQASIYLHDHYTGGKILADDAHTYVVTRSGIPMQDYINSADGDAFATAAANPTPYAQWVVLRLESSPDQLTPLLKDQAFLSHYRQVFTQATVAIYERTP